MNFERTVYEEILPHLPISRLTFYGAADEPGTEFSWLFLEDAGDEEFTCSVEDRRLAARWLGQMHVSAARIAALTQLPDGGPNKYLARLRSSRTLIQTSLGHLALKRQDLQILEEIMLQGQSLESQWGRIDKLSRRFPRTLLHGDFSEFNLRVRGSEGGTNLLTFDWQKASYGIPAPDIADARRYIEIELDEYFSVVREAWSELDFAAIRQLADIGAVFRLLAAIRWGIEYIGLGLWPTEKINRLHSYQVDLAVALERLGFNG
jgi:hypothetical protein